MKVCTYKFYLFYLYLFKYIGFNNFAYSICIVY